MVRYFVSSTHKVMTTLVIVMFGLIWPGNLTPESVVVKFSSQLIICIILFCRLQASFTHPILRICMGKSDVGRCFLEVGT